MYCEIIIGMPTKDTTVKSNTTTITTTATSPRSNSSSGRSLCINGIKDLVINRQEPVNYYESIECIESNQVFELVDDGSTTNDLKFLM
jgi:hypothetical protein